MLSVAYFDQLSGGCPHPKAGQNTLSAFFYLFSPFKKFFSDFTPEIKKSTEKIQIWGTPSGSQPAFACQPALKSRQKWINTVFLLIFRRFFLISGVKSLKKVENGWKSVSTSFRVRAAPKSWSKHTTVKHIDGSFVNYLQAQSYFMIYFKSNQIKSFEFFKEISYFPLLLTFFFK